VKLLENILKGWITTILGIVIMIGSAFAMYEGRLDVTWDGSVLFGIGVILLFCKDQLPGLSKKIINKKLKDDGSDA
jgi:type IV secretory pathway VirB2 component (pilin)